MNAQEVAKKWFDEVWNKKNVDAITELSDSQAIGETEDFSINGPEDFKRLVFHPMVTAFPDVRVAIDGVVSDGDDAVVRWTAFATHQGPFGNIPPSGRRVQFSGMTWLKIRNDKIFEASDSYNLNGLIEFLSTGAESVRVRKAV